MRAVRVQPRRKPFAAPHLPVSLTAVRLFLVTRTPLPTLPVCKDGHMGGVRTVTVVVNVCQAGSMVLLTQKTGARTGGMPDGASGVPCVAVWTLLYPLRANGQRRTTTRHRTTIGHVHPLLRGGPVTVVGRIHNNVHNVQQTTYSTNLLMYSKMVSYW